MSENPLVRLSRAAASGTTAAVTAVLFFVAAPLAAQQTGQITGVIQGATTGQPLAEVQVSVEGTGLGGLTNAQGRYLVLNVPAGTHTLTATLIGYGQGSQEVTVTAGGTATVDFRLSPRAVELEGVVVTGTASAANLREIGNSIELITSEEIEASGAVTMDEVLRGRAPGVSVQGQSGVAGAGSTLLVRGVTSIEGRNRPLIYVDGVRMNDRGAYESGSVSGQTASVLNSINPQDIERIEVIKGAAASTIYGTEASAGVIQIFTKTGAAGEARWTLSVEQGISEPRHVGPDSDPTGLHMNDCTGDPGCPASGSWLRTAYRQEYGLQVRGGSESFSYFASGSFGDDEGMANIPEQYDEQAAKDVNLRANFTFNPAEQLRLRVNNSYTRREISWFPGGDNTRGFVENVTQLDEGETPGNVDSVVFQEDIDQDIDHFNSSINVNWTPSDDFRHRLNVGLDWSQSQSIEFQPLGFWDNPDGARTNDTEITRVITVDYAGSWFYELPANWTSTFEFGGQYNDREDRGVRVDCIGPFVAGGERVLDECRQATFESGFFGLQEDRRGFRSGGFFLQERFGWNNRFFFTAGARGDAFSQLNEELELDPKFELFPKFQATYTISDHDFWPDWWETMRIRAAWGESGDPPPQTANQTLWQIAGADELPNSGLIIQTIANPDIKAERSSEWEGGFDASLLNGRLSAQATGFYSRTTDGILDNPLLPTDGVVEDVPFNAGEWKRWGIETSVDATLLEMRDFRLSTNVQYQWHDNEVVSLGSLGQGDPQSLDPGLFGDQRFVEGKPFPQWFGNPVSNPDEIALPERDTTQALGTTVPNHELSVGLSATLNNRLTLEVFGAGQFGHILLDEAAEESASVGTWPQCEGVDDNLIAHVTEGAPLEFTAAKIGRCSQFSRFLGGATLNEDWLFPADFFRIQSASLTYQVPEDWLPTAITGATVRFRATNLALFTDYPTGLDPDALVGAAVNTVDRFGGFTIPPPRTYSLNLRFNF